jgi:hypothetical protein
MVLVFFDVKSVIYTNHLPKGKTVNTEYMKKILARLLVIVFSGKKALHVIPGLGHHAPHRCLSPGVPGSKRDQDNLPPTLFAGPHPIGLFPLPEGEVGAGWTGQLPQSWEGSFELWAASMSKNNSE